MLNSITLGTSNQTAPDEVSIRSHACNTIWIFMKNWMGHENYGVDIQYWCHIYVEGASHMQVWSLERLVSQKSEGKCIQGPVLTINSRD